MADADAYRVVENDFGALTILDLDERLPKGWHETHLDGSKQECFAMINHFAYRRPAPWRGFTRIFPVHHQAIGAFLTGEDLR